MQVLQWLFKVSQPTKDDHNEDKASKKEEPNSKEIVPQNSIRAVRKARNPEETSLDCSKLKCLALLLSSRGKSRAYFYRTLNKKTLHNNLVHRQQQHYIRSMKTNKENVNLIGNNKVLRIKEKDHDQKQCGPSDQKKSRVRWEQSVNNKNKSKNMSKMKELMRWAAASKSGNGGKFGRNGLYLRSRSSAAGRCGGYEEELKKDSSKRSVRWIVESPSATWSAQYGCSKNKGNWITTDDEFVVLEL